MKILFICRANVGRSQIATAFFNKLSKKHESIGAGTHVNEKEGDPLHEFVIKCMNEMDYDLSKNKRKQLTPKMVEWADKIIVMTEEDNLPSYINMSKVIFWKIEDAKDRSLEFHRKIRYQIKSLVEELLVSINN